MQHKKNQFMKKSIILFAVVSAMVSSCSKDQKVVKELEGDWSVTGQTENGVATPANEYTGTVYTFTSCKVKKGACDGSLSVPDSTKGTFKTPFTYSISEKGEKITITYSILGISNAINGDIVEHSDSKFVYSYTESGAKVERTLTKK